MAEKKDKPQEKPKTQRSTRLSEPKFAEPSPQPQVRTYADAVRSEEETRAAEGRNPEEKEYKAPDWVRSGERAASSVEVPDPEGTE